MNSSLANPEAYDVIVLGCGEGGKYLAWTLAKQGKHVAVVERKLIGGACPNIACLPSKNIIHSAKVADYFRRGKRVREWWRMISGLIWSPSASASARWWMV